MPLSHSMVRPVSHSTVKPLAGPTLSTSNGCQNTQHRARLRSRKRQEADDVQDDVQADDLQAKAQGTPIGRCCTSCHVEARLDKENLTDGAHKDSSSAVCANKG